MSDKDKQNNNLIKSTKSESPETKEQNIEILVDQPRPFENLLKKDIDNNQKEEQFKEKNDNDINNGNTQKKENEKENINDINIQENIVLIDNKNNEEGLEYNLNIEFEQQNNIIKENKEKENSKNNEIKNNLEITLSDRKSKYKYFDDINNSSIVRKEESNFEINTNKKSQGSDYALFKIMNEMGNKNSIPKIKTLESLDKLNPFTSINSQNTAILRHEENKIDDVLKSISEPEFEEEEKSNEDNIGKNNNYKIRKKLSEDINFNLPIEENNKDKKSEISKDIITTSNNDLNEACIKTNENLMKSKMENSDFIENKDKENKNDNNSVNKINIELFFKSNESKNKDLYVEEIKKDIINDIDNMYTNDKLNLVKLNNHEIYNFITEYNDISKDMLEYDPNYYVLTNKDNDFIIRRNNYLSHNYFSYITTPKKKISNEDLEQKLKKHKKNYTEKIPKLAINDSNQNNSKPPQNENSTKILKINDIENISSFFYNFGLYIPENKNKKILDENSENEIIKNFTTYRKIFNDGNSFQRSFSYLLLENFILKNQIDNLNYIIYDIKKTLNEKYLDIDNTIKILINIKESYSIDNLMNSYNNPKINIDEVMVSYIEDIINKINKIDTINKRKHQEINMVYLKTLSNIFDINIEIFYIEENKNKNNQYLLTMNKINIYSNSENNKIKNSEKINDSDEYEAIPTFYFLFFLNSYHIIYTKKSDIDSTLANNEFLRQHFYLPSLPKYNCSKCNKNPSLDIIPYYEAVLCHKCLINYMKDILKIRAISFIKSNFSSIEYFTRPITIKSELKITFTLYKFITGNYLIQDFENILENTCFIFYKYIANKTNKIFKLKCQCQICQKCLEEKIKENMGGFKYLNLYEMHTKHFSKCPCDNIYNINELLKYSKYKPNEKDKKDALQRLIFVLEDKCCVCLITKDKTEYIRLEVANSKPHFICMECYPKNIFSHDNNKNINRKYNNIDRNKNPYHDLESSNSSLKDNDKDKKFFCNICNTEHIILPESDNEQKKVNGKVKSFSKCCKKCLIY